MECAAFLISARPLAWGAPRASHPSWRLTSTALTRNSPSCSLRPDVAGAAWTFVTKPHIAKHTGAVNFTLPPYASVLLTLNSGPATFAAGPRGNEATRCDLSDLAALAIGIVGFARPACARSTALLRAAVIVLAALLAAPR